MWSVLQARAELEPYQICRISSRVEKVQKQWGGQMWQGKIMGQQAAAVAQTAVMTLPLCHVVLESKMTGSPLPHVKSGGGKNSSWIPLNSVFGQQPYSVAPGEASLPLISLVYPILLIMEHQIYSLGYITIDFCNLYHRCILLWYKMYSKLFI